MATRVDLIDGRMLAVWNVTWGYDMGDDRAHVTTNCSPFVDSEPIDVFGTAEVVSVFDPVSGDPIWAA
jgi:hypothetical protein